MRFPPRKPTFRAQMAANNAANRGMEAMYGDRRVEKGIAAPDFPELPAKRVIQHHSDKEELEASVMREVADVILLCPRVILCWRQNGGAAQAADGVFRIWYYRWVKRPKKMRLPDFMCVLDSGKLGVIECKRRDWQYAGTEREQEQKAFIDRIVATGGRGGFATSAEQALQIIK